MGVGRRTDDNDGRATVTIRLRCRMINDDEDDEEVDDDGDDDDEDDARDGDALMDGFR